MSAHQHPETHFFLCLGGAIEHQTGHDRYFIAEKSAGYVLNGEIHTNLFLGDVLTFEISLGERHRGLLPFADSGRSFHRYHPTAMILESAYREFKNPDSYTAIMLESLTFEALVNGRRQQIQGPSSLGRSRWLERAREILHEEFSESITLERIAFEVGVHPAHLAKAFRQRFGECIGDYIRRLRIARTRHLLEVSEMSIGEIAIATGFVDQSHFTKTFKKFTGKTPNAYRGCQKAR
jgi:AraC family transcriptional regulator